MSLREPSMSDESAATARDQAERTASRWGARATPYAVAVALPLGVLAARLSAASLVGERPFLVAFFIPILLSAYLGGLGPGLVATLVAAAGSYYFLVPTTPVHPLGRPID